MKLLREHCEAQVNNDLKIDGGENMNLEEFMKLSWGDISAKVEEPFVVNMKTTHILIL